MSDWRVAARAGRARGVSPARFRLIASAAIWALALTIISGATVRLTGSGLGCPDWPTCTTSSVVAPLHFHAWVEFGNRLINAFVSVASLGAFVAALLRAPRRRDLTWLAAGLVAGIAGEVVLGGLTVLNKLAPGFVMAHFLLAVVILGDAVLLRYRAGLPDERVATTPRVRVVSRSQLVLARLQLVATAVVVTLGTVVTSTGPHGGSPGTKRFAFSLHAVAQLHGSSVEVLIGITLVSMWNLVRTGAPPPVVRRAQVMLVAMVAQAGVGYLQYFSGDPVGLVALHVTGACILVIATLWYYCGLSVPAQAPATSDLLPADLDGSPDLAPAPAPAGAPDRRLFPTA
jgi:cytochrome c oxidase assembly protein subunit 15